MLLLRWKMHLLGWETITSRLCSCFAINKQASSQGPSSCNCHLPCSTLYNPPFALHLPSSVFHLPSSNFHLPSSIFHLPSSIFHLPSSISIHGPSSIFHLSSFIFHLPSFSQLQSFRLDIPSSSSLRLCCDMFLHQELPVCLANHTLIVSLTAIQGPINPSSSTPIALLHVMLIPCRPMLGAWHTIRLDPSEFLNRPAAGCGFPVSHLWLAAVVASAARVC